MIKVDLNPVIPDEAVPVPVTHDGSPAMGFEVFLWPEFLALAKRLGVDTDKPIQHIILDLHSDNFAKVYVQMIGTDNGG